MNFSARYGYKPIREIIQIDSMNDELRNALWSILHGYIWSTLAVRYGGRRAFKGYDSGITSLFSGFWLDFFKKPLDTLQDDWAEVVKLLRRFFFDCEWHQVYDFMEFVAEHYPRGDYNSFITTCNVYLQQEGSAYRFIDGIISRITDNEEISSIEAGLADSNDSTRTHLRKALELQSDKNSPDYRNSIKESISAIESLTMSVVGEKATLGELLKKLDLHPALQKGLSSIYGYTSDADGIRHAMLENSTVTFEDARFFLVTCSAFVNLVRATAKPIALKKK